MSKSKWIATAALALTGTLGVGMAQAQPDVSWSVTIGSPMPVVHLPTIVRHAPVVVAPAPVYVQYRQPTRWDRDGDGIPNRQDRLYNPAWDRDGDGIPNARDRFDNRRIDRDGDGVPNRYDRHDRH